MVACCAEGMGSEFAPALLSSNPAHRGRGVAGQSHALERFLFVLESETSRTWVGCGHRRGVAMPCVAPAEVSRNPIVQSDEI